MFDVLTGSEARRLNEMMTRAIDVSDHYGRNGAAGMLDTCDDLLDIYADLAPIVHPNLFAA